MHARGKPIFLAAAVMCFGIAAVALTAFVRAGEAGRWWSGPAVYLAFVALMIAVEYVRPVEFRSPARPGVLVPCLLLSFGSIVLMGAPMFRAGRRLWLVTVASSVLLVVSMSLAMGKGVG